MPQIDQIASIYASQLFWLVVVFALIYFGIGRAMLPKIERTVEDRDARISGDLAAAEAARAEADAAEATYTEKLDASRAASRVWISASDSLIRFSVAAAERHLDAQSSSGWRSASRRSAVSRQSPPRPRRRSSARSPACPSIARQPTARYARR